MRGIYQSDKGPVRGGTYRFIDIFHHIMCWYICTDRYVLYQWLVGTLIWTSKVNHDPNNQILFGHLLNWWKFKCTLTEVQIVTWNIENIMSFLPYIEKLYD